MFEDIYDFFNFNQDIKPKSCGFSQGFNRNNCFYCHNINLWISDFDNPYIVCNDCGIIQRYIITKNSLSDDSIKFNNALHYKRINYLKELINSINLHYADFKNDKINNIYNLLINNNVKMIYKDIRLFLKLNKLNNYYWQIFYLMFLNDKKNYKTIDYNTKNKIINKFVEIEYIYKSIQKIIKRKKMLNYQFILYKILYLINCPDLIIYLNYPFLSHYKTNYHNEIFNKYFNFV